MFEQRLEMLQNPQCFEENRMESVSDHRWYETEEEAIRQEEMKLRYSLNGIWKFLWAPNPASAPEGFEKPEVFLSGMAGDSGSCTNGIKRIWTSAIYRYKLSMGRKRAGEST